MLQQLLQVIVAYMHHLMNYEGEFTQDFAQIILFTRYDFKKLMWFSVTNWPIFDELAIVF